MNIVIILFTCAIAFLLNACAPSLIHIKDTGVSADSKYPEYVRKIRRKANDNGLLEVQIIFQSSVSRTINYKVEWLDQDGYTLRNAIDERYRALRLTHNEEYVMHKMASDKRAKDVKVHIK
jgi:hypothetical protein